MSTSSWRLPQVAQGLASRLPLHRRLSCAYLGAILLVPSLHAGSIYVTNELPNSNSPSSSSVSVYTTTPAFLHNLVPSSPYNLPDAITVDSALNVYVADASGNRVVEFNSAGSQINVFNTDSSSAVSPSGLAIDPFGTVYVSSLDGVIQKISGGLVSNIGTVPGVARGIAYDPYNGLLYITTQFPGSLYTMPHPGAPPHFSPPASVPATCAASCSVMGICTYRILQMPTTREPFIDSWAAAAPPRCSPVICKVRITSPSTRWAIFL
jgi:hypothetical protein